MTFLVLVPLVILILLWDTHIRGNLTSPLFATNTNPRYTAFCYDIHVNLAAILVVVNEAIYHTTQPHTMLSTNQMRYHGVDVCDVHPKFTSGGQKGKFRIKIGD
jgi:hypothetical protein